MLQNGLNWLWNNWGICGHVLKLSPGQEKCSGSKEMNVLTVYSLLMYYLDPRASDSSVKWRATNTESKARMVHSSGQRKTKAAHEKPSLLPACYRFAMTSLVLRLHFWHGLSWSKFLLWQLQISLVLQSRDSIWSSKMTWHQEQRPYLSCTLEEAWNRGTSKRKTQHLLISGMG